VALSLKASGSSRWQFIYRTVMRSPDVIVDETDAVVAVPSASRAYQIVGPPMGAIPNLATVGLPLFIHHPFPGIRYLLPRESNRIIRAVRQQFPR
jgi:hypothetical protein